MKKKLVGFIILCSIAGAGILKGATKKRVSELENLVVDLSKSERKAWDTIEKMNRQIAELERQAAMRYYQDHKKFAEADEEEFDFDDEELEAPRLPSKRTRSRR